MTFIDRIEKLLIDTGTSKKTMLNDLSLSINTFSNWKNRGTIPSGETLEMIADYFDVSVDYLLGKTPSPERENIPEDEKRLRELLSRMSEEQLQTALKIISAIAEEKKQEG